MENLDRYLLRASFSQEPMQVLEERASVETPPGVSPKILLTAVSVLVAFNDKPAL
jgi:hypothetical protein